MTNEKAVEILQAEVDKAIDDKEYMADDLFDAMRAGIKALEQEPSVGEWEEYGHNLGDDYIPVGIRCSKCHIEPPKRDPHKVKSFMNYIKSKYCPNCGAKMRGEETT